MELNSGKLSRLQLFGTLAIVFMLALTLSGYFLLTSWSDFRTREDRVEQDAYRRARDYLQSYNQHSAQTLLALRDHSSDILKQQLKEQVDQAYAVADGIWRREHGRLPEARVQRLIVEALRPLRFFDGRGYFFIDTLDGHCVLLPTQPEREGSSLLENRDDRGRYIMKTLIQSVASGEGMGFSSYRWYLPGTRQMSEKIAYSRRFAPYDWLIGSGEYLANVDSRLQQQALTLLSRMRLGEDSDDFMVIDDSGALLLYPANPLYEGKHYLALPPDTRARVLDLMEKGKQGGFVEYSSGDDRPGQQTAHLAYAKKLPGWNWTLVTSLHVQSILDDSEKARRELDEQLLRRVSTILLMTLLAMLAAGAFSWFFVRWMNAMVARYQADLSQSHQELEASARELRLSHFMIDNATDMVALRRAEGELVYANRAALESLADNQDRRQVLAETLFAYPEARLPHTFEVAMQCADGVRQLEVTVSGLHYQNERFLCATARDITQRHQADYQLRLAAKVFESSNEAILITDADNRIVAVNHAFCVITGFSEKEVMGETPALLRSGRHDPHFYRQMWEGLTQRGQWSGEVWNRRKNGEIFPEWLNISVLTDSQGDISHYVALFTDISERKEHEARIQHLAEYDTLTDLPNRLLINDRLQRAIRMATLQEGRVAVMFVDLDHFKNINDTLGHNNGDLLLKQVAERLCGSVRDMDTVGRTGGDEFVLILPSVGQAEEAAQVAERILRAMKEPFRLDGDTLVVGCSIGISLMPDDGDDIQTLLMNADLAMYHAKAHGRNTFRFYTREMNAQVAERMQLENRLHRAMENDELYLVYQPQYDMDGAALLGCEALLRWQDPQEGLIMPGRFIPVAEESGIIVELGVWVLQRACRQLAEWRAEGLPLSRVAVNVSARQLARHDFIDTVRSALQTYQLPGHLLEIEVTESTLMEDADFAARQLAVLKAMGVRLSVDDFGTGYSSLAYLKRFAPDTVKIDRSFICDLPQDSDDAAIVTAIIQLAKALGMHTLAEGVENDRQQSFLTELGCGGMQGYLMGAPLSADALRQRLRELPAVSV
ncbi:EAL domain-containing protein [uncultured Aquitalea sp.]|uniref:bifunctional diguanylate cyclase/phosphodiesterase n=1 Tax=uncultured Aquitalea sp. TaxID=540272 RepID=UPI0025F639D8|nr:EAL domain-containing protein [uncultured Aquitalea sp.]